MEASKIKCINAAGFVQEFCVVWEGGSSDWSRKYPNPGSETIDLTKYNIPDGTEVWVKVHAILGKTKESSEHVTFVRNSGNTAVYRVTGTTLNFKIVEVKQELVTVARFGEEIRSTHLQKYYRSEVTFQEGGNQYLFHQSNQDNRWYMAKLSRDWDLQQEIKSGNYQRFYEVLVPFRFNGKNYLFAHSKQDHRWFISELSTSWDGQSEIGNGCWDNYYGCVFIFEQDGKVYLCAHSESDKRFFMTEILIGYETK